MNNSAIRDAVGKAIIDNDHIETWCVYNFEKQVTVFDGIDHWQLPQTDDDAANVIGDYPFVAIDVTEKSQGIGNDEEVVVVSAFCALIDKGEYDKDVTSGIMRLPGADKRDQFRTLVLAAAAGANLDGGYIKTVDTVNLPVEFFPEFAVDMTITICRPYAFRENRFE